MIKYNKKILKNHKLIILFNKKLFKIKKIKYRHYHYFD